ncbi:unnamed protein product [Pneumocystis jirovecii]|uniref:GPI transamidase component GAB1 n=1 Tax=Pneumocystis jirovecii TaxID=42068 RepID=L0P9J6_PNEJI|nr:unnamed protein product [Pneumocystis jirovecii]
MSLKKTCSFLVRIILFRNKNIISLLSNRVEIATTVTSYKRLKEGLFLYEHGISPYNDNSFHHTPLLLALFSVIRLISNSQFLVSLLYTIIDLFSAWFLLDLTNSTILKDHSINPWMKYFTIFSFLLNPYSIVSCVGMSTAIFTNCSIFASLSYLQCRKSLQSIFFLAIATYLSFYPILLLPPLILILHKNNTRKTDISTTKSIILFFAALLLLLLLSFITTGSWDFLSATYGFINNYRLLAPDLTPNVGLWWYFFTEIFDSFRLFFTSIFQLHLFIYLAPLCIRLRKYPFFIIIILCGIMSILKPYPSIADAVLFMSLFPLLHPIHSYMRPIFYYLWINAGSGNANFFYSITLVWNFNLSIIVTDIVFAILKMELEIEKPDMKGVDVIQINY